MAFAIFKNILIYFSKPPVARQKEMSILYFST